LELRLNIPAIQASQDVLFRATDATGRIVRSYVTWRSTLPNNVADAIPEPPDNALIGFHVHVRLPDEAEKIAKAVAAELAKARAEMSDVAERKTASDLLTNLLRADPPPFDPEADDAQRAAAAADWLDWWQANADDIRLIGGHLDYPAER
jgi:hypothetical protein